MQPDATAGPHGHAQVDHLLEQDERLGGAHPATALTPRGDEPVRTGRHRRLGLRPRRDLGQHLPRPRCDPRAHRCAQPVGDGLRRGHRIGPEGRDGRNDHHRLDGPSQIRGNTGHRLGDHERPGAEPERFGGPPGHVSHQRAEPDGFSHVEQAPTTGPTGSGDEPWVGTAAWIGGHHERGGCERIERARFVHGSPVDAGRGRPATPRPGNETCVTPMLPLGRWVLSTGW